MVETMIADALMLRWEGADLGVAIEQQLEVVALLLLVNAEHLLPDVGERVGAAHRLLSVVALVTGQERLRLGPERVVDVPVMTAVDAEAFFLSRADAVGVRAERSGDHRPARPWIDYRSPCSSRRRGCASSLRMSSSSVSPPAWSRASTPIRGSRPSGARSDGAR